jgi:hypothetical protein
MRALRQGGLVTRATVEVFNSFSVGGQGCITIPLNILLQASNLCLQIFIQTLKVPFDIALVALHLTLAHVELKLISKFTE